MKLINEQALQGPGLFYYNLIENLIFISKLFLIVLFVLKFHLSNALTDNKLELTMLPFIFSTLKSA